MCSERVTAGLKGFECRESGDDVEISRQARFETKPETFE